MLSSINPVGERARGQRWWVTVVAFSIGSLVGGGALGLVLGWLGQAVAIPPDPATVVAVLLVVGAVFADWRGLTPPSLRRQVDRTWMTSYRGWVYGLGYGLQLGVGIATYITSWSTWVLVAMMVLVGDPLVGAGLGGLHGIVRAASVWTTATLHTPDALRARHRRLVALAPTATRVLAVALSTVAALATLTLT